MIVKNTTDSALEVQIKGVVYRVEAESELADVPTDVALYWKEMLHNFIKLSDESDVAPITSSKSKAPEKAPEVEEETKTKK